MKRRSPLLFLALSLALSLTACGGGGDTSADNTAQASQPVETQSQPETTPTPEPEKEDTAWEITYQNARTYTSSIGTTWVQVIVEIENTGTSDLYISSGAYDLEDQNGKLVDTNSMASVYPEVISPGEKAYLYEETTLDGPVEGGLTVLPRLDVEKAEVENIRYTVTDLELSMDKYGDLKAMGRVENTTAEDESMPYIVIILKDANGTPIGQLFTIADDLPAGSKIGFEATAMSLPSDVTVDTVASYEVFAYPAQFQF